MLAELSRLGSMVEVAEELCVTTSTVSQQIAVLAREAGAALIEPHGRRVRLTPAGRRLADHAVTILAAVDAARLDLDPGAEPAGALRIAGFATAVRRSLLPVAADLAISHPKVRLRIHELEPAESLDLLAADDVDLALTYDYNLAPAPFGRSFEARPLWSTSWSLGVPALTPDRDSDGDVDRLGVERRSRIGSAATVFDQFRDTDWIANSRNTADEHVLRAIAAMAGFEPRITHQVDSLDLVQDMIAAGFGVGLLPADQPVRPGVRLLRLSDPDLALRSYAVTRLGRTNWPPLALVVGLLAQLTEDSI